MRKHWIELAAIVLLAVLALVVWFHNAPQESPFKSYFSQAEQFEESQNWELARAAWLFARHHADTMYDQRTVDGNPTFYGRVISGAQVYCDYRVAMTFERQGDYAQAVEQLKQVLATPALTINAYLGSNGAREIAKDLSYVREVQAGSPSPCERG